MKSLKCNALGLLRPTCKKCARCRKGFRGQTQARASWYMIATPHDGRPAGRPEGLSTRREAAGEQAKTAPRGDPRACTLLTSGLEKASGAAAA